MRASLVLCYLLAYEWGPTSFCQKTCQKVTVRKPIGQKMGLRGKSNHLRTGPLGLGEWFFAHLSGASEAIIGLFVYVCVRTRL